MGEPLLKAKWWVSEGENVRCRLCFRSCLIPDGKSGFCGVRRNEKGILLSPFLGRFSACSVDPVEKKPLYRWRPGSWILSLGGAGCNMSCPFCQNHGIAKPPDLSHLPLQRISPDALLRKIAESGLGAVAYTYNEPALQAEYIIEAAPLLKDRKVATVLVSNGMFSGVSLQDLAPWVDAANIDVKTFDPAKYQEIGGDLERVKTNIAFLADSGVHVELTNLVVPGISDGPDDFERLVNWIASVSADIPLHISRYFPAYRYGAPSTEIPLMKEFRKMAESRLSCVYLGNVR